MISRTRILLVLAVSVPLAILFLIAEQVVQAYPPEDGLVLANGQLLGGDFIAFYVGGRIFREDRTRLYDLEYQVEYRSELLGSAAPSLSGQLPFVYPPLVAALLSPFSSLPFHRSFWIWVAFGLVMSISSLILVMQSSGASNVIPLPLLLLFSLGFVPFSLNATLGGQIPWLGITVMALVASAILHDKSFLAGVAMSLSYYKPPIFFFMLIVLCIGRGRRFILGFAAGATFLMALTLLLVGPEGLASYLAAASRYTYGQEVMVSTQLPPAEGMGLVGLGVTYFSSMWITLLVLTVPFLFLAWVCCRALTSVLPPERLFGLILSLTATAAFSIQLIKYDLALLLVPMVLGVAWHGNERNPTKALILLPFLGFYFEFALRQLNFGGKLFNASSLMFMAVLGLMTWYWWLRKPTTGANALPVGPHATSG